MNEGFQCFPHSARLLCAADYKAVFDNCDLRAGTKNALLLSIPSESHSRLGLVIAKKNVRLAVQRNRIKRIAREYFRCNPLQHPRDLVFLAKKNLADLSNAELKILLSTLWKKIDTAQPRTSDR
ncbi:MAG: ribonuclease P protein component [Luminiphilus sp.]|jgi:ribonuclease P protein component|nr:ribonuclease P protein component [Luminiphilus sp.]MDG1460077.1 ribonuclease P protein component [Luminiphilus sp.]